jgi:hypothetical protein
MERMPAPKLPQNMSADSKIFELFMVPSFCADGSKKRPSRNTK